MLVRCASVVALLLAGARLGAGPDEARDLPARAGTLFRPFLEWRLENPTFEGNPFDLEAGVTFRHVETGAERTTPMFHDPPADWRFRFSGTRAGEWTFVTSSSDADLDGRRGTVTARPAADPHANGFLTAFGNKWGWQGSDRAFVPQLVMYSGDAPGLGDPGAIERAIETFLVGHGFNGFHVPSIAAQWFDHTSESGRVDESMENPDPVTVAALERLIVATHAAGGMVHIWVWGDHQRRQTCRSLQGGPDGIVARRLERYLAARLGPLPGWSMGFGFDLQEWAAIPGERNLVRTWAARMEALLGWPHLLGGRMGPTLKQGERDHSAQARLNEGLGYHAYEHHRPIYEDYVAALAALPGRPVFSEDRFRIRVPPLYPDKDYDEDLTRRGLYHSTLAGGVANIWGNNHPGGWTEGGGSRPYPHPEWIKTWADFFAERFTRDMERAESISSARCLMRPDRKHYVLYAEDTATIDLDLSSMDGHQPAIAVDTRRPYEELPAGTLAPGKSTWRAPRTSDWVLAIGSF